MARLLMLLINGKASKSDQDSLARPIARELHLLRCVASTKQIAHASRRSFLVIMRRVTSLDLQ